MLLTLLLGSCSETLIKERLTSDMNPTPEESIVVFRTEVTNFNALTTIHHTAMTSWAQVTGKRLHTPKNFTSRKSGLFNGKVVEELNILKLAPGTYTLYRLEVPVGSAIYRVIGGKWDAVKNEGSLVHFTVKPGEVTYLGDLSVTITGGDFMNGKLFEPYTCNMEIKDKFSEIKSKLLPNYPLLTEKIKVGLMKINQERRFCSGVIKDPKKADQKAQ